MTAPDRIEQAIPLVRWLIHTRFRNVPAHIDRDDMFQAAMEAVCRSAGRWQPGRGTEFTSFATRRAIGAIQDHLRREQHGPRHHPAPAPLSLDDLGADVPAPPTFPAWQVAATVTTLNPRLQSTTLRYAAGYTLREIGEQDGVTEMAVYQRMRRAREQLRPLLEAA